MKRYQVINIRSKEVVGSYDTRKAASRKADRLDMEYGAINYAVNDTQFSVSKLVMESLGATQATR